MQKQFSLIRMGSMALLACLTSAGNMPAAAQNVTPTPETGVTPSTLLLYRADLFSGKETAYEQTEAEIVQGYMDAKNPHLLERARSRDGLAARVVFRRIRQLRGHRAIRGGPGARAGCASGNRDGTAEAGGFGRGNANGAGFPARRFGLPSEQD